MKRLLSGWHAVRIIRLFLGLAILWQGVILKDIIALALGSLFSALAIADVGCCGPRGCTIPKQRKN